MVCEEPEGKVIREVSPIIFTPESIKCFYDKASKFPVLFGKELKNMEDFTARFFWYDSQGLPHLYGPIWKIDDFIGVFYLTDLYKTEATAHFAFFDRRFRGRRELVLRMIQETFKASEFIRLNVEIPKYAGNAVTTFVESLGFQREGRKRRCAFFDNQWFDSNTYGILRSEVLPDGR